MRDNCDNCSARRELYHNDSTGLALCEACDAAQDAKDIAALRERVNIAYDIMLTASCLSHGLVLDIETGKAINKATDMLDEILKNGGLDV